MRTNYNFDVFIYYGVILDRSNIHELALFHGFSTVYDFVESQELQHQMIGNNGFTNLMIVGKEIHWDYGSHVTELTFLEDNINLKSELYVDDQIRPFQNEMEYEYNDIELKLNKLGITSKPKHYIITNHGKM